MCDLKSHPVSTDVYSAAPSEFALWKNFFVSLAVLMGIAVSTANAQISFSNVTDDSLNGVLRSESWGVSVGDLDGDNWPDIFVSNHRNRPSLYQFGANNQWWNNILQRDTNASWLQQPYIDTHGAAWSDFDEDGDDDIVVGTNAATYHFLMVSGVDSFSDEADIRLREDTSSSFSTWFDFDKDGLTDLFQGRDSGNLSVYFRQRASIGTFDSSVELAECDGDWGYLTDINDDDVADYICNREGAFPKAGYSFANGTFVDITASLPQVANVVDSIAADFNNDLRADLFMLRGAISASGASMHSPRLIEISSDTGNGEEVIFSFNGGGTLTLKSWSPLVLKDTQVVSDSTVIGGFNVSFDASNDLWTISRSSPGWEYAYLQIRSTDPMSNLRNVKVSSRDLALAPEMYRRENGGWARRTNDAGLGVGVECKSVVAADFDNDMDQDLYMVCGRGAENIPNRLFVNDGNGVFSEVANAGGAGGALGAPIADAVGSGESVVTGDFNNDGWIDLFVTNGNNSQPVRGRVGGHELILNDGNGSNHWIELNLVGTVSDIDATGTRVIATAGGVSQLRESGANYHRWSQNDNRIHFGLGTNSTVDLTIHWPRGLVEQFNGIAADSLYTVTEGSGVVVADVSPPLAFAPPVAGDECGAPRFTDDMDSGVFVYKDCVNDRWHIRATSALEFSHRYEMNLQAATPIELGSQYSIEANDEIASNGATVQFVLNTTNGDMDGFDFDLAGDDVCLTLGSPLTDGARVMLGAKHLPITLPINLDTLENCSTATNNAPVLSIPGAQSNTVNDSVSLQLSATDADGDVLSFSVTDLPPGLSLDGNGMISGTLSATGIYAVNVSVDDGLGASDSGSFQWRVNPVGAGEPTISVADTSVSESSDLAEFVVTLDPVNPAQTVTVTAAGVRLTATPGQDYYGFVRQLSFAPNESTKTIAVTLLDDSEIDPDEVLGVRLYNATNAVIGDDSAQMLIVDNDTSGNAAPIFDWPGDQQGIVSTAQTLTVLATDADGDGLSYAATGLPAGLSLDSASGIISGVPTTLGVYNVSMSVSDGNGGTDSTSFVWTIIEAPLTPTLSVTDIVIDENAGSGEFTITLSPVNPSLAVSVKASATVLSATPGVDYYGFFKVLNFAPNESTKTVSVTVLNDSEVEADEQFGIRLFGADNASIGNATAVASIVDDDIAGGNVDPQLSVPANRSSSVGDSVSFNVTATDADGDTLAYAANGLPTGLSIDSTTGLISGLPTAAGTYNVTIDVSDGNGGSDSGSFEWTIVVDTVSLSVDDVSVNESAGTMQFTVTKTPANSNSVVTVRAVSIQNGTAAQGSDYFGFAVDLTFAVGESVKTVTAVIIDDLVPEEDETLGIRLLDPVNAELGDAFGVGTIVDDDVTPNTPPQLLNPGDQTYPLNATVSLPLSAADADGDALNYEAIGLPAGLQIDATTGLIGGTVNAVGSYSVSVTVADGNGGSDTQRFQLSVRYFDGFETDSGWSTNPFASDDASTGFWRAGNPMQTSNGSNIMQPENAANGSRAMITDPDAFNGLGCCDIDSGVTTVRSPAVDLGEGEITMSFNYFLAYLTNATSADFFRVRIEQGGSVDTVFEELGVAGVNKSASWKPVSIDLSDYAGKTIRVIIEAADNSTPSLIEAGIDDLTIE